MTKSRSVRLFVCYSHRDEKFREALGSALSPLLLDGRIVVSHDRRITPGRDWDAAIHDEIDRADLIVVLVSAHFFHSGYCTGVEMARALERAKEGTARVLPVVVRPDWSRRRVESAFVEEIRREVDELVWMVEVSLPELFPTNLRKVGEVLVRADRDLSGDGGSVFLRARIPGWSCVESPRGAVPGEFEFRPCRLLSHVPLFGLE